MSLRVVDELFEGKRPTSCVVHGFHAPRVFDIDVHHIWPLGHGGPDVESNRVAICPTGHRNVHELLALWLKTKGDPGWPTRRRFSHGERELARRGYYAILTREQQ